MATRDKIDTPDFVYFTKSHHHKPYPFISPTRPELTANGKNVVVTGGGTGIGKAIAIAFGQAGAKSVAILGRRVSRLEVAAAEIIAAAGPTTRVVYESADLSQRTAVDGALKSITDQVGKIDIFVSNAGILPDPGPVVGYDIQELTRGFELNVVGAFNALQAFVPLAAPGAKIFNISSGIAHFAPMPGMFAYAANKAAILKMFDYVAVENPELHVVHVQPGVVATEINSETSVIGQDDVELPGAFLVWLASREANFLKGKFVWVNWDAEELISRAQEIESSMLLTVYLDGVPM
ncbi:Fc.00g116110.m01.CDS01 [Cosmosporella sp. VM-42]